MTRERTPAGRLRARLHADEHGFTLIEVMVAVLIFGILIGGVAAMQNTTLNMIRNDRHRSVAANLAAAEMDTVRSTLFTSLPIGELVTELDVGGVPYTVKRESAWVASDATAGACDAPQGAEPVYLRVNVSVSWRNMNGIPPVESHTIVTPPVGTFDINTGHLAIKVLDRDGEAQEGIPVAIAGPQSQTQTTTSDGCVFFAFLTPGSYTASLSAPSHVDDQFEPAPSQTATVITSATASLLFLYDRTAALDLTLVGADAGSSAPSTVPLVIANTHLLPAGSAPFAGSGSPRLISDLFPYVDGYQVWAGQCLDADPVYLGGERGAPIAVEPGQTSVGTVSMPEVRVTVQNGLAEPVPGVAVNAIHAADTGCPSGETYSIGTTDAGGGITFALPFGTWQIQVGGTVVDTPTLTPGVGGPYTVAVTQ